ncbi:MAG TPA: hypothetical protein VFI60_00215 [Candidatus Acidoferrum sp.]|nr:hypothetical protein [Candidatus Acidoferrum sp.]
MGKTNKARVILGGLLAGLILNIFEYVLNGVVFASQWDAFEKAIGRQMRPGAIPFFIVSSFVAGIGVVWLYAAARPRLGPGPKTAALTGIAYWFFAQALPDANSVAANVVPGRITVIIALILLVGCIIASLCGASVYKEPSNP